MELRIGQPSRSRTITEQSTSGRVRDVYKLIELRGGVVIREEEEL